MATITQNIKRKPYINDSQLKRVLYQLMSMFSGYQVRTGRQRDGKFHFIDVPIMYGSSSRTAGYIIAGSENFLAKLPVMSLYMTGLTQKADWRINPQHYEKYSFIERARDPDGNLIVNQPGKRKIIERAAPAPYELKFDLAIWASNNDQGYQIVEQLLCLYNPGMDVMLSNSPADWTFLTTVFFDGDVRPELAVPEGDNPDPLYVFTMSFNVVIWMSLPAKVYELKDIREIHLNIKDFRDDLDFDAMDTLDGLIIKPTEQQLADN